jgi:hypothetical protein
VAVIRRTAKPKHGSLTCEILAQILEQLPLGVELSAPPPQRVCSLIESSLDQQMVKLYRFEGGVVTIWLTFSERQIVADHRWRMAANIGPRSKSNERAWRKTCVVSGEFQCRRVLQ